MLHSERMCAFRKQHATPWTASISKATHTIRYWYARLARKVVRENQDVILNCYLAHSDAEVECFDKTLTIRECFSEMRKARARFKDIVRDAKSNGTLYELEGAEVRVERKNPITTADNKELSQERDDLIQKELKVRENRRTAQRTFRKLGRQIRGHVRQNSAKKSGKMGVEAELRNNVWKQLTRKEEIEEHLIARNVEQLSHAGETPFGYTPWARSLVIQATRTWQTTYTMELSITKSWMMRKSMAL
jgi:hypothetical protein